MEIRCENYPLIKPTSAYSRRKCRCDVCKNAWNDYQKSRLKDPKVHAKHLRRSRELYRPNSKRDKHLTKTYNMSIIDFDNKLSNAAEFILSSEGGNV